MARCLRLAATAPQADLLEVGVSGMSLAISGVHLRV